MKLPRAILFDLDDPILVAFGPAQSQWQRTIAAFADQLGPIEATVIAAALATAGHPVPTEAIGDALADAYNALHDEEHRGGPLREPAVLSPAPVRSNAAPPRSRLT